MKRHAIPLILVTVASGLASADVPDILSSALQAQSPSGADGVLVLDEKRITLGQDGRVQTRIHQVQRILTDQGLDAYGDPWIQFNAGEQDLEVKTARVARADGETVSSTPNAITEITPNHVTHAPRFADLQDMIITLLGLETGAAAEIDVVVEDRTPYRKLAYGSEPLHDARDVVKKEISFRMPAGKKLSWFVSGAEIEPEVEKGPGGTSYVFSLEDVASLSHHEAAGSDLAPVLYWMEKTSSKKLATRLLRSAPYALGKKEAEEEADAIIAVLEEENADEMWGPVEEALGIHRRVADDIATIHVDRSIYGDSVLRPSRAFAAGYADPIEKLGILHTVFSRLGYDPVPLVSLRHDPGGANRLHPDNVEGLWLRIAVQGHLLYLDATSSATGEPRGEHVYALTPGGLEEAPFVKPATTRMRLEAVIDLTADEPVVKGTALLRGGFNPYWSLFSTGGGCPVEKIASLIGDRAGFTVTKATFTRLALDETIIAFTGSPTIEEGRLDVLLPSLIAGVIDGWEIHRPDRALPILVDEKKWERVRIEIRLPDGATVLYAPDFDGTKRSSGPVSIFHSKGLDAGHVALTRRVTLSPGTISPSKVGKAKDVLADALAESHNRIVVQLPVKP